ncbi:hypothetical protein DLAC_09739 [Tieghemostelium lacteum]|uniref:Uncharacterized protein n=1 Tax=Tieghemostelium lacteum TaxID=361077 RepID=A0A151Z729_TIELA|nr:hypothetical protein DLAC_09739 [Tieghemostelium lacteum]|eukprot:KYQ89770.1 hypothetical protein DLAC_09739 [Tieghemostelium lacteum]
MSKENIVLTEKQKKRSLSFENTLLRNKRLKSTVIESSTKYTTVKNEKELNKKSKRKWMKLIPSHVPSDQVNQCHFIKPHDKTRCKNKLFFKEDTRVTFNYCQSHIYMDESSGYIQCRGCSKFKKQCLKAVLKEKVFCKKHLHPDYKEVIENLKNEGVLVDDIVKNKQWEWKVGVEETNKTQQECIEQIDVESSMNGNDIQHVPIEFKNNRIKRIEALRDQRLNRIQENQIRNPNSTYKSKKNKNKNRTKKFQKQKQHIHLEKEGDSEISPVAKETPKQCEIVLSSVLNKNDNTEKFFNKVSNLLDSLFD